ncbi:MAG: hypothetical protein AB1465_07170 [Patescibacteria group bacterium]
MKFFCKLLIVFIFGFFGCEKTPLEDTSCDNYGEKVCGRACGEQHGNTCLEVSAVLWCDGYRWQVANKCYDNCWCEEEGNTAYCECSYY